MLWTDKLLTGVQRIDDQHKELVDRAERILDAGKEGRGAEEIGRMLQFLQDYVAEHFRDEEELQQRSGYSGYAVHKVKHDDFESRVQELIDRYNRAGPTLDVLTTTNKVVVDWLIMHIQGEDKAFAAYYRESMANSL